MLQIGAAAHELGHALGFLHTQSRHDRDSYVTVMKDNIRDGWLDQFTMQTKNDNHNYGLPYDYGSLMHYGSTSGSKDKKGKLLTMVPFDPEYAETLGSPFISFIDLLMMNKHYNCTEKCKPATSAKCKNGGFPHPRNCSECICPGGYGGPLCKDRPEGCGAILAAGPEPLEFENTVGNKTAKRKPREDFDMCYYWITAPVAKKVVVELLSFKPDGIAVDGCIYGGVEFKWKDDQRLTGSRYCSREDANTILTSTSNIMPIITYNRIYESTTRIRQFTKEFPDIAITGRNSKERSVAETVKSVFKKAAELWTNGTCLDIYEDENATDSIRVIQGGGCYSYVGRIGGMQNLSIGEKCSMVGAAAHELGHALGFFHAHSRPDRDRYITVLSKNIRDGWQGQFLAGSSDIIDIYGLPYDYGSIMQYGGISGSKDKIGKLLTMVPLDLAYIETLGSPFISFTDLLMMNKHYNCTDKCKNDTSAKCENHGFPHPRNCSMCICPGGYGGPLCKNRPEGCGEILVAQYYPIEWTASVGRDEDNKKRREDFDMCYYWIKAPVGKKVMVELLSFKPEGIAVDGCIYAGVEVKWQADQRRSGSRYCSPHGSLTILKSFSNIVPIIMYSRHYRKSTTRIRYQYVDS
ncbi:hypothetical protein Q1695_001846 [Nippostrongylus brasiliensis]|nr:hypothetical protein Q1695_001846 [Nippostrongylus brasiliensis]